MKLQLLNTMNKNITGIIFLLQVLLCGYKETVARMQIIPRCHSERSEESRIPSQL
jgi:hypothetical protein